MDKDQFLSLLTETTQDPNAIRGIFQWCDQWCEKCEKTEFCTLYKTTTFLPFDSPNEMFETLSMVFTATIEMLKEYCEKNDIQIESTEDSDFEGEYEMKKYEISSDDGVNLAKQYREMVKHWLDSLKKKDAFGMEVRLQDLMLTDCFDIIQWYLYMLEMKLARALMSQKDEEEEQSEPYDSLGNAKLLLVSIERNIGAWGYIYQKFKEDEDEILDILICLKNLSKKIELIFPDARAFIRPGLDD